MPETDPTTFLSGTNAEFIAELYGRYLENPEAVDDSWRRFFAGIGDDLAALEAERAGPAWAPRSRTNGEAAPAPQPAAVSGIAIDQAAADSIRAMQFIRAYRVRGHLEADLD